MIPNKLLKLVVTPAPPSMPLQLLCGIAPICDSSQQTSCRYCDANTRSVQWHLDLTEQLQEARKFLCSKQRTSRVAQEWRCTSRPTSRLPDIRSTRAHWRTSRNPTYVAWVRYGLMHTRPTFPTEGEPTRSVGNLHVNPSTHKETIAHTDTGRCFRTRKCVSVVSVWFVLFVSVIVSVVLSSLLCLCVSVFVGLSLEVFRMFSCVFWWARHTPVVD